MDSTDLFNKIFDETFERLPELYEASLHYINESGQFFSKNPKIEPIEDLRNMTEDEARIYCKEYFWNKEYSHLDPALAESLYLVNITTGPYYSHKLLQKAVGCKEFTGVFDDNTLFKALGPDKANLFKHEVTSFLFFLATIEPVVRVKLYTLMSTVHKNSYLNI